MEEPEGWEVKLEGQGWLSSREKQIVKRFIIEAKKSVDRPGPLRCIKFITVLQMAHSAAKMSVTNILKNKELFLEALDRIKSSGDYSPDSKKDMVKFVARYYNFVHNGDTGIKYAPKMVKKAAAFKRKANEDPPKKPVLTRKDIRQLVSVCDNVLDSAIIFTLFESGARISEFCLMKKSFIQQTDKGLNLHIQKVKTKERYCPVVECKKFLNDWLSHHPIKTGDPLLWVSPKSGKPLGAASIQKRIKKVAKRLKRTASFSKPVNVHHFRHSRVTEFFNLRGTPPAAVEYFGWSKKNGIGTAMGYYHGISTEQMETLINAMHGEAPIEDLRAPTNWQCYRCEEKNSIAIQYCGKCGASRNANQEAVQSQNIEAEVNKLKEQIEEKNEMVAVLYEAMEQAGGADKFLAKLAKKQRD